MGSKNKNLFTINYKLQTIFLGKERDYFIENLSMLIAAGMPILGVLDAIAKELRSRRMKKILAFIREYIESGSPIWKALQATNLFADHTISLIRLGEESGKLTENLKVVANEQEKNRVFHSKLRSAIMYPVFVLSLTVIIGVGIAWFILPKLALVFAQLKITLPLITKVLIGSGTFLGEYGQYVVPAAVIAMSVIFFFIFSFPKTKFIGQFILFSLPGVKQLIKEVELARLGYLLGTLLDAGLPVTQALNSLASATEIAPYRKLYKHLRDSVEEGNPFRKSFISFRRTNHLIPEPIQQLIVAGEHSGTLSATLLKIGETYETKADTTTKNLTVILEPILLVIVWLGVVAVALAVILPIYSLIGGFNADQPTVTQPPPAAKQTISPPPSAEAISPDTETVEAIPPPNTEIIEKKSTTLRVLPTSVGYLNAREKPSLTSKIVTRVKPGETFEYTEKNEGWYKIVLPDGNSGWVFGKYVEEIEINK